MHEPRQQVSAAKRRQAGGRQRLQPRVGGHTQIRQCAEGRIVADQPLCVAKQAPGQAEELHGDDRDRQR